jgi:isoquinoline 1-oxidoreductase beta subunit
MLVPAAATRWGVAAASLSARDGVVRHADGRQATFGELAAEASRVTPPPSPLPLKPRNEWRIVGTRVRTADARDIVTGRTIYGIDATVPGALVAVIERCPFFDGTLASFDDGAARRIPGVRHVVAITGPEPGALINHNIAPGVAVVADDTWAALKGRAALRVQWNQGPWMADDTDKLGSAAEAALRGPGTVARRDGDFAAAAASAARVVEASYTVPVLAHATMEPQNCTVHLQGDRAIVYASMQSPGDVSSLVSAISGIPRLNIDVRLTRAGGGFGRRLRSDFVC